jgi:hypothetical protein
MWHGDASLTNAVQLLCSCRTTSGDSYACCAALRPECQPPVPRPPTPAAVDWIIQYDPPDDPREYIHRVGRTARGKDGKGRALLLLMPEELPFLKYLKQAKVRDGGS